MDIIKLQSYNLKGFYCLNAALLTCGIIYNDMLLVVCGCIMTFASLLGFYISASTLIYEDTKLASYYYPTLLPVLPAALFTWGAEQGSSIGELCRIASSAIIFIWSVIMGMSACVMKHEIERFKK